MIVAILCLKLRRKVNTCGEQSTFLKMEFNRRVSFLQDTVKPVLSSHSKEDRKLVCKTLLQVKSVAECSKGSIPLQGCMSSIFLCHGEFPEYLIKLIH